MTYKIQSKSDFLTGSSLLIKIPEKEVDYNALHTIQSDCPDFIVPFHYKSDGEHIELVYKIGTQCKLQYFSGEMAVKEYFEFWQSVLRPLLDCKDWLMNPCSFLLNTDHLYYDKNRKTVNYIYIPSVKASLNHEEFYKMAVDVSKMITVADAALENKVLRAVMKDFNPMEFLQMLADHISTSLVTPIATTGVTAVETPVMALENTHIQEGDAHRNMNESDDDFIIEIQSGKKSKSEKRKKEKNSGGYKIFGGKSKKSHAAQPDLPQEAHLMTAAESSPVPPVPPVPVIAEHEGMEVTEVTQNELMPVGHGLRCVGHTHLPSFISVEINLGEIFTIGRFDAAVGKKQSSFEFEKRTKAVSRRHAVIERDANEYKIVDLSSSAGTFVNDKKLPPNTPHSLEKGCRVSFGNSGADYVWEAS